MTHGLFSLGRGKTTIRAKVAETALPRSKWNPTSRDLTKCTTGCQTFFFDSLACRLQNTRARRGLG